MNEEVHPISSSRRQRIDLAAVQQNKSSGATICE